MSLELEILILVLCILLQGFFSGTEIALMGADRLLLRVKAEDGDAASARVLTLLERPARLVSTCLAGGALASVAAATVFTHLVTLALPHLPEGARLAANPTVVVAVCFPPIAIIFAELIPKTVFHQNATLLAPRLVVPILAMAKLLRPILWVTENITFAVARMFGVKDGEGHQRVRREDIQLLLDNSPTGDIRSEEREMILRVFSFSEKLVQDAMVPLIEVIAVPETATVAEAVAIAAEHGFSRLPVYRKRVDRMVGIVTHSDLMFATDLTLPVSSVMHEMVYAPETKRVDQLFIELRRRRQRVAVAVDEYGGGVGLISIEDILEELVGDIEDEFDKRRPLAQLSGENEWLASARIEAESLRAITGFDMPDGDYETIAGLLLERLGHVPAVGEKLVVAGWTLVVTKANERAILEVSLTAPAAGVPGGAR